jgi:hypothetical protein
MSILEGHNHSQDSLTVLFAQLAPEAKAINQRGMRPDIPMDLDILARTNRGGIDFTTLLDVFNELETSEDDGKVDTGVMGIIFNILQKEVHLDKEGLLQNNPLSELPELIIESYSTVSPIKDSINPILNFAKLLRDRKQDLAPLEAGSYLEGWKNEDVWALVSAISIIMLRQSPGNILMLKKLAKDIDIQKPNMEIHDPAAIRLLMNIQTVWDGSNNYRNQSK